jgi:hypothetical protein
MREVALNQLGTGLGGERGAFVACLATILELAAAELPGPEDVDDRPPGPLLFRWLASRGVGLVPIFQPDVFNWPGPWLARARDTCGSTRPVVMYGFPSGVAFDPLGGAAWPDEPACSAGTRARSLSTARLVAGHGIEGDRHIHGTGTFPSGLPGSALTLIEQRVCEELGLAPDEHRRNLVIDGLELNRLVGHGGVRCRGMRLCEPCTVVQRYAGRPVLRRLVHRGGLRADVLTDGEIETGDRVVVV